LTSPRKIPRSLRPSVGRAKYAAREADAAGHRAGAGEEAEVELDLRPGPAPPTSWPRSRPGSPRTGLTRVSLPELDRIRASQQVEPGASSSWSVGSAVITNIARRVVLVFDSRVAGIDQRGAAHEVKVPLRGVRRVEVDETGGDCDVALLRQHGDGYGGGAALYISTVTGDNLVFAGNQSAAGYGGALMAQGGDIVLSQVTAVRNASASGGGAVLATDARPSAPRTRGPTADSRLRVARGRPAAPRPPPFVAPCTREASGAGHEGLPHSGMARAQAERRGRGGPCRDDQGLRTRRAGPKRRSGRCWRHEIPHRITRALHPEIRAPSLVTVDPSAAAGP